MPAEFPRKVISRNPLCPGRKAVCGLPRISEPVEKVVVGPVGGPKEARNKAKTLHKRSF
jgi:hypothetical protein